MVRATARRRRAADLICTRKKPAVFRRVFLWHFWSMIHSTRFSPPEGEKLGYNPIFVILLVQLYQGLNFPDFALKRGFPGVFGVADGQKRGCAG
jgi:hypothetical protein